VWVEFIEKSDGEQLIRTGPGVLPCGQPPAVYRAAFRAAWLASHLLRFAHRFAAAFGRRSPFGELYRVDTKGAVFRGGAASP